MSYIYSPAVTCYEEHGTASEDYSIKDAPSASVKLRCAWADRYALVQDLLSYQRPWPYWPGLDYVPLANVCKIEPFPSAAVQNGQGMDYEDALITVTYSTLAMDLVSEELEPTVEFMQLDHRQFCWGAPDGPPLTAQEAPGVQQRGMNLVRTRYLVVEIPPAVLLTYGCCNASFYTSPILGLTFNPQTLLYMPPHTARTIRSDGTDGWTVTMKFVVKPQGWNVYWNAKLQEWSPIFVRGGLPYFNYPLADFTGLWF